MKKYIYIKNSPPIPHLLQAQQAPALLYAKEVRRPGPGSYPAPSPDPTTQYYLFAALNKAWQLHLGLQPFIITCI